MAKWWEMTALRSAYQQVARNSAAAGADGVTPKIFAARLDHNLQHLSAQLGDRRWRPLQHVIFKKPKTDGGFRILAIPCVADRVWLTALARHLSALWEPDMAETSYAFRSGRGVNDAVAKATILRLRGFVHVAHVDIASYFDNLRHCDVNSLIDREARCNQASTMVRAWLAGYGAEMAKFGRSASMGIPQGAALSPVLANHVLTGFDKAINGRRIKMLRYADDILLMARSQGELHASLAKAQTELAKLQLSLRPSKTEIICLDQPRASLDFLGYCFAKNSLRRAG